MSTTARNALHDFLVTLYGAQADPETQDRLRKAFANAMAGSPDVPDLHDPQHRVKNVLSLTWSLALPKFAEGYVLIPDPRDGPEAQAVHDKFRDLNVAAQQEQSDSAEKQPETA